MICAQCGLQISVKDKVLFRDRCSSCDAPLHACVCCTFYKPGSYNECREPRAERVLEKKRENRCEYFKPGDNKPDADTNADETTKKFNDLFS